MKNKECIIEALNRCAQHDAQRTACDGSIVICLADMVIPEEQKCLYRSLYMLSCFGRVEVVDFIDKDTHIDTLAKVKFTPWTRA